MFAQEPPTNPAERDQLLRLSELLASSRDGAATLDSEFRFLFANGAAEQLLGKSLSELEGKAQWELFPATVGTELENQYRRAMLSGEPAEFDNFFEDAGRWCRVSVQPARGGIAIWFRDITEQREAERQVQAQRRAFLSLLEHAPAGMVVLEGPQFVTRLFNPGYEALMAGRQVSDRTFAEVWPEAAGTLIPLLEEVRNTGAPCYLPELRALTRDESTCVDQERSFALSCVRLTFFEGRSADAVLILIIETTGRLRLQQEIENQADKFRLALEAAKVGTWAWDVESKRVEVSPQCNALFGIDPGSSEICSRFFELVHPEDRRRAQEDIERSLETASEHDSQFRVVWPDGSVHWIASKGRVYSDSAGRPVRMRGVAVNIDSAKEGEKQARRARLLYDSLAGSNLLGIITIDHDRVIEANDRFLEMLGYTRGEFEPDGIECAKITPEQSRFQQERMLREVLRSGSVEPFEHEFSRKDGFPLPVVIGATLIQEQPRVQVLCFVLDMTAHVRLEKRMLEKQKLESIGMLAAGIAHDFNNLLVGVLGNACLAEAMLPQGHVAQTALTAVRKASEQAADLTRQMLAYAGKGRFFSVPVNLSTLYSKTCGVLRSSISVKIDLITEFKPDLPRLSADEAQMQQLLTNLVMNAAEAIADRGAILIKTDTLTVDQEYIDRELDGAGIAPGAYVSLLVRDTGAGMDEATKSKIFDPFFSTKFLGRGLGLAAVAGIVRSHNGAIKVESAPGRGSSFLILLPANPKLGPTLINHFRDDELAGSGTILVADDEAMVRSVVKEVLRKHGYEVLTAESGAEALSLFKEQPDAISLVILDLTMPGIDGRETLEQLRRIRKDVPVLASSGFSERDLETAYAGLQVSGFIQKPYTGHDLAAKVKMALRRPS